MKTINGLILKQMIISGANNLYNSYPEIDALNVFPVPDGDTGTNMNLTISSGSKEVANRNDDDVYTIAKSFSKGLLMGARGNSGVILSQIFKGFSVALEGKSVIGAVDLAEAFFNGQKIAYKAVMRPVEGTILTVIRESATYIYENVTPTMTIEKVMELLLKEARASLKRTPDLLPVLKEVGVVDSGGAGLIKILEGFQKAILGNVVEKAMATVYETTYENNEEEQEDTGYCIEFVLKLEGENKKPFVSARFEKVLNTHGKCIELKHEQNEKLVKAHIHSLLPGSILNYGQQYGEFLKVKVENLSVSHTKLDDEPISIENTPLKEYAIIAVAAGDGIAKMFTDLRADYIVSGGQTMNPSTEDFISAIKQVHAKNVIILPNNSNIIMAASQACEVCDENVQAKVIPTKTIPQGLVACMMFNPDLDLNENVESMGEAVQSVKTGQVTFSIKDTNIDGVDIKKDDYMGIVDKNIICCNPDKVESAFQAVKQMVDEFSSIITIIVGADATEEQKNQLLERINNELSVDDVEIEVHNGNQPVYDFIIGVE